MNDDSIDYPCVGICRPDPEGYCLGCGRPFDMRTDETPTTDEVVVAKADLATER